MDSNQPINDAHFILAQILNHPEQLTHEERLELIRRAIGRLHAAEREARLKAWPVTVGTDGSH